MYSQNFDHTEYECGHTFENGVACTFVSIKTTVHMHIMLVAQDLLVSPSCNNDFSEVIPDFNVEGE